MEGTEPNKLDTDGGCHLRTPVKPYYPSFLQPAKMGPDVSTPDSDHTRNQGAQSLKGFPATSGFLKEGGSLPMRGSSSLGQCDPSEAMEMLLASTAEPADVARGSLRRVGRLESSDDGKLSQSGKVSVLSDKEREGGSSQIWTPNLKAKADFTQGSPFSKEVQPVTPALVPASRAPDPSPEPQSVADRLSSAHHVAQSPLGLLHGAPASWKASDGTPVAAPLSTRLPPTAARGLSFASPPAAGGRHSGDRAQPCGAAGVGADGPCASNKGANARGLDYGSSAVLASESARHQSTAVPGPAARSSPPPSGVPPMVAPTRRGPARLSRPLPKNAARGLSFAHVAAAHPPAPPAGSSSAAAQAQDTGDRASGSACVAALDGRAHSTSPSGREGPERWRDDPVYQSMDDMGCAEQYTEGFYRAFLKRRAQTEDQIEDPTSTTPPKWPRYRGKEDLTSGVHADLVEYAERLRKYECSLPHG